MPDQTYLVPFRAKKSAQKNLGAVDMEFKIPAPSAKAAAERGLGQLINSGEHPDNYFKDKPRLLTPEQAAAMSEPSAQPAEHPDSQGSQAGYNPAPESWESLKEQEKADPDFLQDKEPVIAEPTGSNGTRLTLAELNGMIEALEVGQRLILPDIEEALYRPSTGYSTTNIKMLLQSCPAKMKAHMDGLVTRDSASMRGGRAAHCATLEPDRYRTDYVAMPEGMTRRGNAWKEFAAEHEGKEILTQEEYNKAQDMAHAVMYTAGSLFVDGVAELSGWLRISDKIVIKARADYLIEMDNFRLISDLKTAQSCSDRDIIKACSNYGYHIQMHVYTTVFDADEFVLTFVESEPPYLVRPAVLFDEEKKVQAARLFDKAIDKLTECETLGAFEGYSHDKLYIGLQKWERNQEQ